MNDTENEKSTETENSEAEKKDRHESVKRKSKSQTQLLQEALGLGKEDTKDIEQKLYLARFFDYFTEDTFDFCYKERSIGTYKNDIGYFLEDIETEEGRREEDKLLKKSFENKEVVEVVSRLKDKAEELAMSNGFEKAVDKRLKVITLAVSLPIFGVLIIIMLLNLLPLWYIFPILCVGCMAPQLIRGNIMRKWYNFKEAHKTQFFTENRDDIMVLKACTQELIDNMRTKLIDMEVPIQLIKFVLHSRDYENLDLVGEKRAKGGSNQYFFSFAYPEGMEPFPMPDILLQQNPDLMKGDKPEKNFIILTEMKGKNGVISNFIPALKAELSDKINGTLNECEFSLSPKNIKDLIPRYSEIKIEVTEEMAEEEIPLAIYCTCGEIAKVVRTQICNYKSQFKFYLFEAEECQCGEKIFALSLMDESDSVPEELREIFLI